MAGLFTSLGLAGTALEAAGAAVRTVGQNIANANADGYTRQRVQMVATPADELGRIEIGTGVEVARVERIMDGRMEELIRDSLSSLGDLDVRDRILGRIEDILGNLDDDSIATALSEFFAAAEDLASRPEDHSARTLFLARAEDLASAFRVRDEGLRSLRADVEAEVVTCVDNANRLAEEIAALNDQIVSAENGGLDVSAANDLRDRRGALLKELSEIVGVKAIETSQGAVNVLSGSDFLVLGDQAMELTLDTATDGDVVVSTVRFAADGKALVTNGGKLEGLLACRDATISEVRGEVDLLARTVIAEVNRIHSSGIGLVGWSDATGTTAVADPDSSLADAGLVPPAVAGYFDLKVVNETTGLTDTYAVSVPEGASLRDIATAIRDAASVEHPDFQASVTLDGRLRVSTGDPDLTFWFSGDTSGAIAGLGLGTLFTGSDASDIGVNAALIENPSLVSTGLGDGPTDGRTIEAIIALRDAKILEDGGATLEEYTNGFVGALGVERSRASDLLSNEQAINEHLENERSSISGVNIDDESLDLIRYQRAYQGAARFLTIVDSLLEALLNA
jgi:flagellar hook-associated protein 1 FlgK